MESPLNKKLLTTTTTIGIASYLAGLNAAGFTKESDGFLTNPNSRFSVPVPTADVIARSSHGLYAGDQNLESGWAYVTDGKSPSGKSVKMIVTSRTNGTNDMRVDPLGEGIGFIAAINDAANLGLDLTNHVKVAG